MLGKELIKEIKKIKAKNKENKKLFLQNGKKMEP